MNFRTIISTMLFLTSMVSCAQQKQGIRKAEAFFSKQTPGNIPVGPQGNSLYEGPDTINTIYLETYGTEIKWVSAWKNGISYSVITTPITETPFIVGVDKQSNQKIILTPATGNKLWQLQLVKDKTKGKSPGKAKRGEIILQGKSGRKTITQRIGWQSELYVPLSV